MLSDTSIQYMGGGEYSYLEVGVVLVVVMALAAPVAFALQEVWDLKYTKSKCRRMWYPFQLVILVFKQVLITSIEIFERAR